VFRPALHGDPLRLAPAGGAAAAGAVTVNEDRCARHDSLTGCDLPKAQSTPLRLDV
jgi:hypothetical protein